MVILALVFGSLIAMGTPIVAAAFALAVGLSAIGLLGHVMAVPSVAPTLATMIGLGVGIDYSLFLVTKHLDQLGEGMEVEASIANAVASSGSAIVFAGSTVVIALASLAVAGIPLVTSLGFASAIAVLMAVLASITLLPAILSLLGDWVRRVKVPAFLRPKPRKVGERRWDAWARGVARHPWVAVMVSLVILVPLIDPAVLVAVRPRRRRCHADRHHRTPGLRPDDRGIRRRIQRAAADREHPRPGRRTTPSTRRSTTVPPRSRSN